MRAGAEGPHARLYLQPALTILPKEALAPMTQRPNSRAGTAMAGRPAQWLRHVGDALRSGPTRLN